MEPIISTYFIEQNIDLQCNSRELILLLKKVKVKLFIRPHNYESLKKNIYTNFKPKKKNLIISITGILPSGERTEVIDDDTYKKDISLFIVSYKISRGQIFPDFQPKNYFTISNLESPEFSEPNYIVPNVEDFKRKYSNRIREEQNKKFDSIISDLDESIDSSLNRSVQDIIFSTKQEYAKKLNQLKLTIFNVSKTLNKKEKYSNKIANDIRDKILSQMPSKIKFIFEQNRINALKNINEANPKKIRINKMKIYALLKKKNSNEISWLKEENSDKDINFDQSKISNEFPFDKEMLYKRGMDFILNYNLDLIVEKPKEGSQYRMFISIIDNETKQKLSKPLEIIVKMINK